jgi:S-adenosylmethionine decarboxylase
MALVPPPNNDPLSSPGPFEGPEKLLEVWFAPSPDALPTSRRGSDHERVNGNRKGLKEGRGEGYRGLRNVPRAVWEEMLDIVKCKVLSVVEGDEIDAYLLR